MDEKKLKELARLVRYWSLACSTKAGSGHPTSSLSATELMTYVMFERFRFDFADRDNPANDRLIFSKGHASPLYYSLFAAAGVISEDEMMTYRQFGSRLEGHPTSAFPYTEAATGSLGQGLSIGVGMALNGKYLDKIDYTTYVLMGDGEMAEGSVWEALAVASHYKLDNLVAVVDVNRLGQSDPTMLQHNMRTYKARLKAFGWAAEVVDGHDLGEIDKAFKALDKVKGKPKVVVAKTLKGKGVKEVENKNGWHGKALPEEMFEAAKKQLGEVDFSMRGEVRRPVGMSRVKAPAMKKVERPVFKKGEKLATRKAYGHALAWWGSQRGDIVAVDGDVKNSTYSEVFGKAFPGRFFDMYIAEQNMVGAALGLSLRDKQVFASSFAAFLSRAYDQIRMSQYSDGNVNIVGSHAGVSIGEDGASQMALEDLAMMRAVHGSVVFYPSDAVAARELVGKLVSHRGVAYMRTTRMDTPIIYDDDEQFIVGGSKAHWPRGQKQSKALVIGAGVTLHEGLKAQKMLEADGIGVTVVDLYSIKPVDEHGLREQVKCLVAIDGARHVVVVEDHWPEGGLGDVVCSVFADESNVKVHKLAVHKIPHSGKPEENLAYQGIDEAAIVRKVKGILG